MNGTEQPNMETVSLSDDERIDDEEEEVPKEVTSTKKRTLAECSRDADIQPTWNDSDDELGIQGDDMKMKKPVKPTKSSKVAKPVVKQIPQIQVMKPKQAAAFFMEMTDEDNEVTVFAMNSVQLNGVPSDRICHVREARDRYELTANMEVNEYGPTLQFQPGHDEITGIVFAAKEISDFVREDSNKFAVIVTEKAGDAALSLAACASHMVKKKEKSVDKRRQIIGFRMTKPKNDNMKSFCAAFEKMNDHYLASKAYYYDKMSECL